MKVLKINFGYAPEPHSIYTKRKQHRVRLPSGKLKEFSSKKAADKFIADTNAFMTDRMMDINFMIGVLESEYRELWPYFRGRTHESNKWYRDIESRIRKELDYLTSRLNFIGNFKRDYQPYIFTDFEKMHDSIIYCAKMLVKMRKKRGEAYQAARLEITIKNAERNIFMISNYGSGKDLLNRF